ncbi:MAG TPA: LON peptidase substrate-binding domain-containing protein [Dehalococcoidia bacterium]|nr:LON peptidase substrate-binding domain-containing protein [Dehalococcoidia bacterium]
MHMPLFLLNTTLFPGALLPLHVFEDRYRLMISECLRQKAAFGVVLIREGLEVGGPAVPYDFGTTASITHVQRQADGSMNLMTVGGERFRIAEVLRQTPFYLADVEIVASSDSESAHDLADRVGELFAEYYKLYLSLSRQWAQRIPLPADPAVMSDHVAARLDVPMQEKQRLLETLSVPGRLQMEQRLLEQGLAALRPRVQQANDSRWQSPAALN